MRQLFESPGNFNQTRDSGGIVHCSMIYLVSVDRLPYSEVIPVGGVDDVFILQLRVVALDLCQDIARVDGSNSIVKTDRCRHMQRNRPE